MRRQSTNRQALMGEIGIKGWREGWREGGREGGRGREREREEVASVSAPPGGDGNSKYNEIGKK